MALQRAEVASREYARHVREVALNTGACTADERYHLSSVAIRAVRAGACRRLRGAVRAFPALRPLVDIDTVTFKHHERVQELLKDSILKTVAERLEELNEVQDLPGYQQVQCRRSLAQWASRQRRASGVEPRGLLDSLSQSHRHDGGPGCQICRTVLG